MAGLPVVSSWRGGGDLGGGRVAEGTYGCLGAGGGQTGYQGESMWKFLLAERRMYMAAVRVLVD